MARFTLTAAAALAACVVVPASAQPSGLGMDTGAEEPQAPQTFGLVTDPLSSDNGANSNAVYTTVNPRFPSKTYQYDFTCKAQPDLDSNTLTCMNGDPIDTVNCNQYQVKEAVWLTGGPQDKGLGFISEPGVYYFAVVQPGGQSTPNPLVNGQVNTELLSNDTWQQRVFEVTLEHKIRYPYVTIDGSGSDRGFVETLPTQYTPGCWHDFDPSFRHALGGIRLYPFNDGKNSVFDMAICRYSITPGDKAPRPTFAAHECKYDNFKIESARPSCPTVPCPDTDKCVSGVCVPKDPCDDVVCHKPGEVCENGVCVCPPGEDKCKDIHCVKVDVDVDDITFEDEHQWGLGKAVYSFNNCPDGWSNWSGETTIRATIPNGDVTGAVLYKAALVDNGATPVSYTLTGKFTLDNTKNTEKAVTISGTLTVPATPTSCEFSYGTPSVSGTSYTFSALPVPKSGSLVVTFTCQYDEEPDKNNANGNKFVKFDVTGQTPAPQNNGDKTCTNGNKQAHVKTEPSKTHNKCVKVTDTFGTVPPQIVREETICVDSEKKTVTYAPPAPILAPATFGTTATYTNTLALKHEVHHSAVDPDPVKATVKVELVNPTALLG